MSNIVLNVAEYAARYLPTSFKRALYRNRAIAQVIRVGLNRVAPNGLVQIRVAAGGLAGMPLVLDLQTEKDYWLGTYEPELYQAIQDWVHPGMVVFDVGANIGYVALLFATKVGGEGRVFAFEALPDNVNRMNENLKLNRMENRVFVIPKAVVDRSGRVKFKVGPSSGMGKVEGSAGRQESWYGDIFEVQGIALDAFVYEQGNPAPDVIKMDIEGGEVLALSGMEQIIREKRPVIFIELHGPEAANISWNMLIARGYHISRMKPGYPEVAGFQELDWKAYLVAKPIV